MRDECKFILVTLRGESYVSAGWSPEQGDFGGMIQEHLSYLRHLGRATGSIYQRGCCLVRLERFLGHELETATRAQLLAFVSRGDITDRGPDYRCAEISHVKGYYAWAVEHDHLCDNPAARLRRPTRNRHYPKPMPDRDLSYALAEAPEPIRTWIAIAAYAGLRCCEIARLRGEDYLAAQGVLIIQRQKGGDMAIATVGPELAQVLAALPTTGWWFTRWDGVPEPIAPGQLSRHGNRWLHAHGISHTMHTGRHWFGTQVQRLGKDIRTTQEALRHLTLASTMGYTAVDNPALARIVADLPWLGSHAIPTSSCTRMMPGEST